jgi:hypothetical protein
VARRGEAGKEEKKQRGKARAGDVKMGSFNTAALRLLVCDKKESEVSAPDLLESMSKLQSVE